VRVSQPACAATSSARSSARCSGEPKPRRNLCPGLCVCMVSFWSSVSGPFSVDSHRLPSQSYAHCSISVSRRTARAPRGKAAVHASGPLSLLVFPRSPSKTFCFDMFSKTNALQCIEKPWRHKMAFVTEKIIIHVSFIAFASRTCCHCQNLRALEQPRKQCTEMHWPAGGLFCKRAPTHMQSRSIRAPQGDARHPLPSLVASVKLGKKVIFRETDASSMDPCLARQLQSSETLSRLDDTVQGRARS